MDEEHTGSDGNSGGLIGVRKGYVNSDMEKVSFSMYNRLKLSIVWNRDRWFFGASGNFNVLQW